MSKLGKRFAQPNMGSRIDLAAKRFRATRAGGPEWRCVKRRVTVDLRTGEVIEDVRTSKGKKYTELIPKGPRDIKTILFYEN